MKLLPSLLFLINFLAIHLTPCIAADIPPGVLEAITAKPSTVSETLSTNKLFPNQIYKVSNLKLNSGAKVIFNNIHRYDWIAIVIDNLDYDDGTGFTRTDRYLDYSDPENIHGIDGQEGNSGQSYDGSEATGQSGEHGMPGGAGTDGKSIRMPLVYIFVKNLRYRGSSVSSASTLDINFTGLNGGNGGNGAIGGNGGNGARGKGSIGFGLPGICHQGPGQGGNGGNGGNGGPGGAMGFPGNGSDGSTILGYIDVDSSGLKDANILIDPGVAGTPGKNAPSGGKGGKPGLEGSWSNGCTSSGRNGIPGLDGKVCALQFEAGTSGVAGRLVWQDDNVPWPDIFSN